MFLLQDNEILMCGYSHLTLRNAYIVSDLLVMASLGIFKKTLSTMNY